MKKYLGHVLIFLQEIRKGFCPLVLLPGLFQILFFTVSALGVLFAQGDHHLAERNGIGVL